MTNRATLLVEGTTDVRVMTRLREELGCAKPSVRKIRIDPAEIIDASKLNLGHRELVEHVCKTAAEEDARLAGLVDREFRQFQLTDPKDLVGSHFKAEHSVFWTRGHSIENYFFTVDYTLETLRHCFAEKLPESYETLIRSRFDSILLDAAALGLSLKEQLLLGRSEGAISVKHWNVTETTTALDVPAMVSTLAERQAASSACSAIPQDFAKYRSALSSAEPSLFRWIAHGHIGTSAIWTAIAATLQRQEGCQPALAAEIALGYNDEKVRTLAHRWATRILAGNDEAPSALLEWLNQQ